MDLTQRWLAGQALREFLTDKGVKSSRAAEWSSRLAPAMPNALHPDPIMVTDQHTQRRERSTDSTNDGTPVADHAPVTALIAEEYTLRFAGLADGDAETIPGNNEHSPEAWCGDDSVTALERAIAVLPRASSGELWATNEFVETDGTVDVTAIESVHGLDTDALEQRPNVRWTS